MALPQITNPGPITETDWAYYLQFTPADFLQSVADGLRSENRYFVDERFQKLLFNLFFDPQSRYFTQAQLLPQQKLFRARIYNESDVRERFEHPEKYRIYQGFGKDKSGAPPLQNAKSGRANPDGISYLYTTTDENTAIKEVRAQSGEYVSVAAIVLKDSLFVVNLTNGFACMEASAPERTKWINDFALCLEGYFQSPAVRIGGYYLCQFISEYAKLWHLQGIAFRSSFSQQTMGWQEVNVTIFDERHCDITATKLYYVAQMQIEIYPPLTANTAGGRNG